jgi:ribosome biogenesis GTPase / thiamine phosphate phosphatase
MRLEELGYNISLENFRTDNNLSNFGVGRVIAEHKERYIIGTDTGEFEAEITGNLRFTAKNREDFPAVGDWVAITAYDTDFAIIHKILPRYSVIKRQAVGQPGEIQIIAANIDYAFLIQAADRDFNINRLERYLTICNSSKVKPIIVLSKIDLINENQLSGILGKIKTRIKDVPVIALSNESKEGHDIIKSTIEKGKTYCMLGSSGVGKSTLLNNLSGKTLMQTGTISLSTEKGRHITSHRELVVLETGGILIDNPGMREVGIADSATGLAITFDSIVGLSKGCRFKDCTHTTETGCSVLKAVEEGEIEKASYENYLKMEKEKTYFESTVADRRKRDRKFGKIMKNYKKDMRNNIISIFGVIFMALVSCTGKTSNPSPFKITGTWKLIKGTLIEKSDTTVTDYTKNISFIKIINDTHFAFLQHDLKKGEDSDSVYVSGGGRYSFSDSLYTEHLEYCSARIWEGNDFMFKVSIKGDTLIQTGIEKIESAGINRINTEMYIRLMK